MNRITPHRYITTLTIAFVTLACFYVGYLAVSAYQLSQEREYCKHTNLDTMSRADYQHCLNIDWWTNK